MTLKVGWSTNELQRTCGEIDQILGLYVTRALHANRISNVENIPRGEGKRKIMGKILT